MRRFEPGQTVALRYITRAESAVGMTWPARIVCDQEELVALWIPEGAEYRAWERLPGGARRLAPARWRRETLRLMFPGRAHSVWCSWEGPSRTFRMYYINFEEPFRRTAIGFDTNDHALDIVVWPDYRWEWKDLDEFEALARQGVFTEAFARAVRAESELVLSELERRTGVFEGEWSRWQPPSRWTIPELPRGWAVVPPEPWELRDWAYRPHLAPR